MTDIRDVDPAELAYAEGGSAYVGDGYCGTPVPIRPGWPLGFPILDSVGLLPSP